MCSLRSLRSGSIPIALALSVFGVDACSSLKGDERIEGGVDADSMRLDGTAEDGGPHDASPESTSNPCGDCSDFEGGDSSEEQGLADAPSEDCAPACPLEGSFSCATETQVQMCTTIAGCRRWVSLPACAAGAICCDGACWRADEPNCYACGRACSGTKPTC